MVKVRIPKARLFQAQGGYCNGCLFVYVFIMSDICLLQENHLGDIPIMLTLFYFFRKCKEPTELFR